MRSTGREIDAIASDPAAPNFDNTVAALERSGRLLARISNVFYVLAGAHTNDAIQAIERDMAPALARHWNEIHLNEKLFARLDALHRAPRASASRASRRGCWSAITRCSAAPARGSIRPPKQRLKQIGDAAREPRHDLRPERARPTSSPIVLPLSDDDLAGLPDFARAAARGAAEERGLPAMR